MLRPWRSSAAYGSPCESPDVASTGTYSALWDSLLPVGRVASTGGYRRFAWSSADLECREWFRGAAADRGMDVEQDRNGNLWAWWGTPGPNAFVAGSHLDSVPDGGAYDGPLGVVSAFAAVDLARARGIVPVRPVAVVAFSDEEGARFGIACIGSQLLTGVLDPDRARSLTDADGVSLAAAMTAVGADPRALGRDAARRLVGAQRPGHLGVEHSRPLLEPEPVSDQRHVLLTRV